MQNTDALAVKREALERSLRAAAPLAVAFSGGVDSTLLVQLAHDVLGDRMLAVTLSLRSTPARELERAATFCAERGIPQRVIRLDELEIEGFRTNPKDRCYHCKKAIFSKLLAVAAEQGMVHVADGSNVDDMGDYRPGLRALAELGVLSPLRDACFTKADVRVLSRELGLPTWDMPSAACLASRFAYGDEISAQKLERVGAAEDYLHELGFSQLRVRVHGPRAELARIELPSGELALLAAKPLRAQVVGRLRELGFLYVSLDLAGFRSGSMNEAL